ncbi:MAG: GDYXXLXY domain-containing protein, partial [Parvibaculum sp.]
MNRFALAVLALLIGQSLFLAAMVWDRVSLLRSDTVVTLETAPVDPRDIFRGDYVILNYAISSLALDNLDGD